MTKLEEDLAFVEDEVPVNYATASVLGHCDLFLSFLNGLLALGTRKSLNHEDLGHLPDWMRPRHAHEVFAAAWVEEVRASPHSVSRRSLWRCLLLVVGTWRVLACVFVTVVCYLGAYVVPLLSRAVLESQELPIDSIAPTKLSDTMLGAALALALLIPLLVTVMKTAKDSLMNFFQIQMESALKLAVHCKILSMGTVAQRTHSIGDITNIFSKDISLACSGLDALPALLVVPVQLAVGLVLVYEIVGPSSLTSVAAISVCVALQAKMSVLHRRKFRAYQQASAEGIKCKSEVFQAVRGMKYYAWELPFNTCIKALRQVELQKLHTYMRWKTPAILIAVLNPILLPVLTFYTFIGMGEGDSSLSYAQAVTVLMLYTEMIGALQSIPDAITVFVESSTSAERIRRFLSEPDLQEFISPLVEEHGKPGTVISLQDATLGWFDPSDDVEEESRNQKAFASGKRGRRGGRGGGKYAGLPTTAEASDPALSTAGVATTDRSVYSLRSLSLTIADGEKGKLVAIVGPVGSGKSSLLCALFGELKLHNYGATSNSSVRIRPSEGSDKCRFAYTQQLPWIFNATVRDNILFGEPYDTAVLQAVIEMTCLQPDLDALPCADQTEIGERGINLSGGQKARVSFARALYKAYTPRVDSETTDVFLLDDPLSAVDAHTANRLFRDAILGGLVRQLSKTVLLVTHQVHYLSHCDQILVLGADGSLLEDGSYAEIASRGKVNLQKAVASAASAPAPASKEEEDTEVPKAAVIGGVGRADKTVEVESIALVATASLHNSPTNIAQSTLKDPTTRGTSTSSDVKASTEKGTTVRAGKLIIREGRKRGVVTWDMYSYYIGGGGFAKVFSMLVFIALGEVAMALANYVILDWGSADKALAERSTGSYRGSGITMVDFSKARDGKLTTSQSLYFVNTYMALCLVNVVVCLVNDNLLISFVDTAAKHFHELLVDTMLQAPVSFYDVTPIGRILNLFSADLRTMNLRLFGLVYINMSQSVTALSAIVMILVATNGTAFTVLVPMGFLYYRMLVYYRSTNTELSRLVSLCNSPIIVEFSQTLNSLISLRAYAAQEITISRMDEKVHKLNSAQRLKFLMNVWLAARLETLGATISFFCMLIQVVSSGFVSPEAMALAVLYAQALPRVFSGLMKKASMLEAGMASVERVHYAIKNTPQESYAGNRGNMRDDKLVKGGMDTDAGVEVLPVVTASAASAATIPPDDWPNAGVVEVTNLTMKYSNKVNNPFVLQDVSFATKAAEKVGVVGRTGSGKSSLIVALFQIEECEPGTSIRIDGIELNTVPLAILRSRLGIILQESLVFSESLRFNVDPFNEYTDAEVWDVLDVVSLREAVEHMQGMLAMHLSEGGSNLSHGQRQLLCIARAILRRSKVLVLDEATASIDNETDERIQKIIRERFKNSTIITVAHRLNTIIDYDRVLVLQDGAVAEFDTPSALLAANSLFKGFWDRFEMSLKQGY